MTGLSLSAFDPLTAIRILCGIWLIPHIIGKSRNLEKASATFKNAGFRPERLFVKITIAVEIVAACGLIFGIFPQIAALLVTGVLLGAAYAMVRTPAIKGATHRPAPPD